MNYEEVLEIIRSGEMDAEDLLNKADPKLAKRFKSIDRSIVKLLKDVQKHFPNACYYTGSGGFKLLLGPDHDGEGNPLQDLVACCGTASISDGDW